MQCEICQKRKATDVHHKDENHKNNKPDNLQNLCKKCHAEIHGIEPRDFELTRLVMNYHKIQKSRVALSNRIDAFLSAELIVPIEMVESRKRFIELEEQAEKDIANYFKENPLEIHDWMTSIKGISDILAGKIIGSINMDKTPGYSNLKSYSGYAPPEYYKKNGYNYNHDLKMFLYQVGDSFIKQRTPKYRNIYDKRKEEEIEKCKELVDKGWKGYADNRARRVMIQEFLKDLYTEWNGIVS